jgi:hypothetical protein
MTSFHDGDSASAVNFRDGLMGIPIGDLDCKILSVVLHVKPDKMPRSGIYPINHVFDAHVWLRQKGKKTAMQRHKKASAVTPRD